MKFLAEFTTIIGVYIIYRVKGSNNKWWKLMAIGSGILTRVIIMSIANVLLLPLFIPSLPVDVILILFLGVFNALQGAISIFGGFLFYEAVTLRFQNQKVS